MCEAVIIPDTNLFSSSDFSAISASSKEFMIKSKEMQGMNNPYMKISLVLKKLSNLQLALLNLVGFLEKYMTSLQIRVVVSVVIAKEPMCRNICNFDKAKPWCFTSLLSRRKASTRMINNIVLMTMSRLR